MKSTAHKKQGRRANRSKEITPMTYEEFRKSYGRLAGAAYEASLKKIDSKIEEALTRH